MVKYQLNPNLKIVCLTLITLIVIFDNMHLSECRKRVKNSTRNSKRPCKSELCQQSRRNDKSQRSSKSAAPRKRLAKQKAQRDSEDNYRPETFFTYCYSPAKERCLVYEENERYDDKPCYNTYEDCLYDNDLAKTVIYYDPTRSKCLESLRIEVESRKLQTFRTYEDCRNRKTTSRNQPPFNRKIMYGWNRNSRRCVMFASSNRTSTRRLYRSKTACMMDKAPRYCYNPTLAVCEYKTEKVTRNNHCFRDEKHCQKKYGIATESSPSIFSQRPQSKKRPNNTKPKLETTTSPVTTSRTKTTMRTTTTQAETTRTEKTTLPDAELRDRANEKFRTCCLRRGLAEDCVDRICNYSVTPDQVRLAYLPLVGACTVSGLRSHSLCATRKKNNIACCKEKKITEGELKVCEMFCNPNGNNYDWPQSLMGARHLERCGKVHRERMACHFQNATAED